MNKFRVSTTISNKHHELLMKYLENFGTQQRVLEHALENFETQSPELSQEAELWMRIYNEIKEVNTIFQRDIIKLLFKTADIDEYRKFVKNEKPAEFALEWYYSKPLKEFTLQELVDGVFLMIKIQGGSDTVGCSENNKYHTINLTHNMGINWANGLVITFDSIFKSYGVTFESKYSERSVFFKIFK